LIITTTTKSAFQKITESLGLSKDELEPCAEKEGYRITFEKNFTVELMTQANINCRSSARICLLGKSLQVQEQQLQKALELFTEVRKEAPRGLSLTVSDYDNCLRIVTEIKAEKDPQSAKEGEDFEAFLNFAFAFKHTFITTSSTQN
jgi:hypothetical protein